MSKFKALKEILEGVAPTVAKEGEEAAASALAKEAEEAAAREAYKAEFDANPIFYHGSPFNDIKEFIPSKEGMSGPGIYATTNPEVASEYATGSTSGLGNFLKQNKDAIKSPTVYPIKVRGKLFDRENPQDVWDLLRHQDPSLPNVDFSGEWWKDPDKLKLYNSKVKELENYTEAVKKSGMYTGIKTGDEHTAVIFDPKNIRSIFAKFDPAMKESGNISAGLAGAGLLGGAALSTESAEASEASSKMPTKEEMLKDYVATRRWPETPREESKAAEDRRLAKERTEDFEKNISEDIGPIGSLGYNLTKGLLFDERPPEEFEEGGGGITEPIVSPIDFITPGMVAAPAKALGRKTADKYLKLRNLVQGEKTPLQLELEELANKQKAQDLDFKKLVEESKNKRKIRELENKKQAQELENIRSQFLESYNTAKKIAEEENRIFNIQDKAVQAEEYHKFLKDLYKSTKNKNVVNSSDKFKKVKPTSSASSSVDASNVSKLPIDEKQFVENKMKDLKIKAMLEDATPAEQEELANLYNQQYDEIFNDALQKEIKSIERGNKSDLLKFRNIINELKNKSKPPSKK